MRSRWRAVISASASGPAARVARTVARIPPPAACSSSYKAPPERRSNSSTRSPAKHGVRVAVDEPGERAEAAAVELLDLAVERRKLGHRPDRLDPPVAAENEGVLDHVHLAERGAAQGRAGSGGRDRLSEVADEERHAGQASRPGSGSPLSSAAASASS